MSGQMLELLRSAADPQQSMVRVDHAHSCIFILTMMLATDCEPTFASGKMVVAAGSFQSVVRCK